MPMASGFLKNAPASWRARWRAALSWDAVASRAREMGWRQAARGNGARRRLDSKAYGAANNCGARVRTERSSSANASGFNTSITPPELR